MSTPSAISIGTSGWTYDSWRGPFYPDELPRSGWLPFYSGQFATTEINNSFYRTPTVDAVKAWRKQTPAGFTFAWKASKFITHWKKLGPASPSSIELLESRIRLLGGRLGPILFQLPANFKANRERLVTFLGMLPRRRRYAFEFRHASWYDESIFDALRNHDVALCWSDHHDAPAPWQVTASHVYIRGHGPTGDYRGRYSAATLSEWAKSARSLSARGIAVNCYFDNDQKSAAPADASALLAAIDTQAARPGTNQQTSQEKAAGRARRVRSGAAAS